MDFSQSQQLNFANGGALTGNADFSGDGTGPAAHTLIQLETTGFSGTIAFQGKPEAQASWTTLGYVPYSSGIPGALANTTLSFTTDTTAGLVYVLPLSMPFMRVVMTRSAGSIVGFYRTLAEPMGGSAIGGGPSASPVGYTTTAITQVTTGASAAAVAARAGRGKVTFVNRDTTSTNGIYISVVSPATANNSVLIPGGGTQSFTFYSQSAFYCLAQANTPLLQVVEEY